VDPAAAGERTHARTDASRRIAGTLSSPFPADTGPPDVAGRCRARGLPCETTAGSVRPVTENSEGLLAHRAGQLAHQRLEALTGPERATPVMAGLLRKTPGGRRVRSNAENRSH